MLEYDPFGRGRFPVGVRTIEALDAARDRRFSCEIWYPAASDHAGEDLAPATQDVFTIATREAPLSQPAVRNAAAQPGTYPLILYSHHSGGHRRAATFLCTHLSSHGYVVAALDHSEVSVLELGRRDGETPEERNARMLAVIASRVPDACFLLDHVLASWKSDAKVDAARIGIAGHSFGGWTALAVPDVDPRIRAVVAVAPGGSSRPRPGILPVKLPFTWGRDVPTLFLAAENDVPIPLDGVIEIFERTPATKRMVILRRADHMHFMDRVEEMHEAVLKMQFPEEMAWMQKAMRPMADLCSGEQAHLFVRGLALAHLDATLQGLAEARQFLAGDLKAELASRGVDVMVHLPLPSVTAQ